MKERLDKIREALLAPPAAAVPAEMKRSTLDDVRSGEFKADAYVEGWNECRAAMLAAANKENTND